MTDTARGEAGPGRYGYRIPRKLLLRARITWYVVTAALLYLSGLLDMLLNHYRSTGRWSATGEDIAVGVGTVALTTILVGTWYLVERLHTRRPPVVVSDDGLSLPVGRRELLSCPWAAVTELQADPRAPGSLVVRCAGARHPLGPHIEHADALRDEILRRAGLVHLAMGIYRPRGAVTTARGPARDEASPEAGAQLSSRT
jgi:hypothetical protein